jgi:4-amino-4-deoxy-L-arabinose transferase-like glycosyltransferase
MKHENSDSGRVDHLCVPQQPPVNRLAVRLKVLILSLIFLTTLGVRLLNWHDIGNEVSAVQTSVTLNYKHQARLIRENGLASLYDPSSSTSNPDLLGHPLGYPILLSLIYRFAPESDTTTQLVQIILDSLAAVIICLIALELFPTAVAVVAGLMAAFAPQFSWNSILLLPDSLAAIPILLAVLLILRTPRQHTTQAAGPESGHQSKRLLLILAAGALIGVSCWLRANALLLAPFLALLFPIIYKRGQRLRPALLLVGGACLVIAPLTIRNATVFGKFIPLSLGAGQTLIEGIADYNSDGSLGLPQTDMELIRGEAEAFQRPDYANSLFTPDGPARDRARLARGLAVVRAHPLWFSGVMVSRAASMLRLERTPLRLATTNSAAWQNLFQWPLRTIQKIYITAIFLPLVLIGAGVLIYKRQFQSLAILLVVPCYYFCTQSALHTEYRYVLVIHYFLFVLAAVAIYSIACQIKRTLTKPSPAESPNPIVRGEEH